MAIREAFREGVITQLGLEVHVGPSQEVVNEHGKRKEIKIKKKKEMALKGIED